MLVSPEGRQGRKQSAVKKTEAEGTQEETL
jgi:hypothetical protein